MHYGNFGPDVGHFKFGRHDGDDFQPAKAIYVAGSKLLLNIVIQKSSPNGKHAYPEKEDTRH
jgi:hypothetical protein